MDLDLTPEQKLIRDTARTFATQEVLPQAAAIDRQHRFPKELVAKMGELGLMALALPEASGHPAMDTVSYALALEEISRACASTGVIMSVLNSLVCDPILRYGSDQQKQRWLPALAGGPALGCFALSEPEAGSDASAQRTTAARDGAGFLINGTKNFITNGPVPDVVPLFAPTDPGHPPHAPPA